MKTWLLLLIFFLFGPFTYGQIDKGSWIIGGIGAYNLVISEFDHTLHSFIVTPELLYFPRRRFAVGGMIGFNASRFVVDRNNGVASGGNDIQISPMLRYYYYHAANSTFSAYVQGRGRFGLSYQVSNILGTGEGFSLERYWVDLGIGADLFLSPMIALEFEAFYLYTETETAFPGSPEIEKIFGNSVHLEARLRIFLSKGFTRPAVPKSKTTQGTLLLGGNLNFVKNDNKEHFFSIEPIIGIFALDRFVLGSGLLFSTSSAQIGKSTGYGFEPFARYYIASGKRLLLFPALSYEYGSFQSSFEPDNFTKTKIKTFKSGFGFNLFLFEDAALEIVLYYAKKNIASELSTFNVSSNENNLELSFGFTVFI